MNANSYMPICLDLLGERCLVVGGGKVALRKITVLKQFGAKITCLSPKVIEGLEELIDEGGIAYIKGKYSDRVSLKGYKLVVAATDDSEINARIARRGRGEHVLVNVVDGSSRGDVIMPAILKKGALTIGVSTGGYSPVRAKKVRDIIRDAI
jgi:siroheme synthase-like protein